jgi:hypothetical protein
MYLISYLSKDADGRKYITKVKSEQTKNHQGTTNEDESHGGRMYATGSKMCPVSSFNSVIVLALIQ